jgi:UDP-N-acetylmuramoyl-L-alanyl-D-glutamate--2,6-diaminopimelate ligase
MFAGLSDDGRRVTRSLDGRARAIHEVIREAAVDDVILIAGKGHEAYQEIEGVRHAFSDLAEAEAALATRREREA